MDTVGGKLKNLMFIPRQCLHSNLTSKKNYLIYGPARVSQPVHVAAFWELLQQYLAVGGERAAIVVVARSQAVAVAQNVHSSLLTAAGSHCRGIGCANPAKAGNDSLIYFSNRGSIDFEAISQTRETTPNISHARQCTSTLLQCGACGG